MQSIALETETAVSDEYDQDIHVSMANHETLEDGHLLNPSAPKRRKDRDPKIDSLSRVDIGREEDDKSKEYRRRLRIPTLQTQITRCVKIPIVSKFLSFVTSIIAIGILKRFARPSTLESFLIWMENHPIRGLVTYMIVYPIHMIVLIPSTPLVMGAGFVFKVQYGWVLGVSFCSIVTLLCSLLGSIICFLLARYCFRSRVRKWSKRYPIFDPIDEAVSENGFRIMSLLYLTPIIPLGPVSYMMGTTSMPMIDFAKAKIAALPLTIIYVYMGAATGTLMTSENAMEGTNSSTTDSKNIANIEMKEMSLSPRAMVLGILFSIISVAFISYRMKIELEKVRTHLFSFLCLTYVFTD